MENKLHFFIKSLLSTCHELCTVRSVGGPKVREEQFLSTVLFQPREEQHRAYHIPEADGGEKTCTCALQPSQFLELGVGPSSLMLAWNPSVWRRRGLFWTETAFPAYRAMNMFFLTGTSFTRLRGSHPTLRAIKHSTITPQWGINSGDL